MKTQMAANRSQSLTQAISTIWSRGGAVGFYQGLIPWAWIESGAAGAVLLFTAAEVEYRATSNFGVSSGVAGLLGGMCGGIAQAYAAMGFCTNFKTIAITREKEAKAGIKAPSAWATFKDVYKTQGLAGVNRGVNAVAVRQCTNWGSRMGFARLAEDWIRSLRRKAEGAALSPADKVLSSSIGQFPLCSLGC